MYIVSSFLDLIGKIMLKHLDHKNKFRIFSIRCLHRKNLRNTSFFMSQLQKYVEWNNHFCAAHKGNLFYK